MKWEQYQEFCLLTAAQSCTESSPNQLLKNFDSNLLHKETIR